MTAPGFTRLLVSVFAITSAGAGCGGSQQSKEESTAVVKLVELRAQRRRDRMRMRQLEEKMAGLARESHVGTPALPVERVEPPRVVEPEVVGIADDGAEIVYVGEAAQSASVSAEDEMVRERRSSTATAARHAPRPRAQTRSSSDDDGLGVTHERLPNVASVTTQRPSPRARELPTQRARRRPRAVAAALPEVSDYQANVALLRAGRHAEAVQGLRRFARRYARSEYADNAQYWLGEAFYDRKLYAEALVEFELVKRKYPAGNKVPDAELKAAYCKAVLGDVEGARDLLVDIIAAFPDSRSAALAREKLERLAD